MDMYSGCYIQNMDIYSGCYIQNMDIYILDFSNLGTNVANGSIRILTLDITSRIYIQIWVIWVPMLQMDRSEFRHISSTLCILVEVANRHPALIKAPRPPRQLVYERRKAKAWNFVWMLGALAAYFINADPPPAMFLASFFQILRK